MTRSINIVLLSSLLCVLFSCGGKSKKADEGGSATSSSFPRDKTYYLVGVQWGDPSSFNPCDQNPSFPVWYPSNLMYEHLVEYNTLTGKLDPVIGKLHTQTASTISFAINAAARWSDNTPLTAADVKYTYEFGKQFPDFPFGYVWDYLEKITVDTVTEGSAKVERVNFHLDKKQNNPLAVLDVIIMQVIMPKHVMEVKVKECGGDYTKLLLDKMDTNPVVSGPYTIHSYSNEKIVCKRRDDYWGNAALYSGRQPKPEFIIHPIYKSNDAFSIEITKGNLDFSSNYMPRIWTKAKDGVKTWYSKAPYFVPAVIPMMTINVTRYPLNDKKLRQAMAYAINYKNISELAFDGYSPDLKQGLILPFPGTPEYKYYSEEDVQKYGATYNPEKAKKLLAEAGYKSFFNKDGTLDHMEDSKGKKIETMFIRVPSGWTDFEAMVTLAAKDMRAVGIDIREGMVDEGVYYQIQQVGEFDLFMDTPAGTLTPSMPWSRFNSIMSARSWKPVGERMTENYGRYNNPKAPGYNKKVDSLINVITWSTDENVKTKAYRMLNVIFMQDQPTLPLVYRPENFYEFSISTWGNMPTEENPYAPPQAPCFGSAKNILWELTLNKK